MYRRSRVRGIESGVAHGTTTEYSVPGVTTVECIIMNFSEVRDGQWQWHHARRSHGHGYGHGHRHAGGRTVTHNSSIKNTSYRKVTGPRPFKRPFPASPESPGDLSRSSRSRRVTGPRGPCGDPVKPRSRIIQRFKFSPRHKLKIMPYRPHRMLRAPGSA